MTSAPYIADRVCILLHASSLMSQLHFTNKCHYVLVFAQAVHPSSRTVLECDGTMYRFIDTNVH